MNSYIPLQTAAIFFSDDILSETGYWLGVCHGWFHLHGLPLAARSGSEIYKIKNSSCPQRDSNSRPLDREAIALTTRPRRPVLTPYLNLTRFSLCYLNLHYNTRQSVFASIQYWTHVTSVLFCGLNDNYIMILGHGLHNPVFVLPVTDRLFKNRVTSLIFRWQPIWLRWD